MTERDWDLQGARLAGLRFAEWLLADDRTGRFVNGFEPDGAGAWAAAQAHGWVETVRPKSGDGCRPGFRGLDPWPRLTTEGRLELDKIRGLRTDPRARAAGCREALLLWLAHDGQEAGSAELMVSRDKWTFYATPFTIDEVRKAAKFLEETGLIKGWTYADGTYMRPALTASGTQCVEFFNGSVRDFLFPIPAGVSVDNQQNFFGDFNGQNGQGNDITQIQKTGIDAAALGEIFNAMREALSTVEDSNDRDDVEHGIQQLEAAVDRGDTDAITASAGRLQRLGARIGTAAGNTALTVATTEGVKQILAALGLS